MNRLFSLRLLSFLLVAGLLAACSGATDEIPTVAPEVIITPTRFSSPAPPPVALTTTPTPQEGQGGVASVVTEDAWERIQQRGVMIVGTSADYPPFEYYNQRFKIDGFDIALIHEVARQLGVDVEVMDIAFQGLDDALSLGQIDVAIAAISITPEREAIFDFSQVYFVSEDAFVAQSPERIPPITQVRDLATLRVGVQKGSVFQDWLEDELVRTGLMPETNLFIYGDVKEAVPDLESGRVDILVLDKPAAELLVQEKGLILVASGLHRELYGIAMAKGQQPLRKQINQALSDMLRNHVVDELAREYMSLGDDDLLPVPTPTPLPPQPLPSPTPPQGCYDGLIYVEDLTYDDQNMTNPPILAPGEAFRKGWRVQNSGTCIWDNRYILDFVYGNVPGARMGGKPVLVQGPVLPGQTYDIYVDLTAPVKPGMYQSFWQMHDADGQPFGQRIYAGIRVPAQPVPTPRPTATPSAAVNFWTDKVSLLQGECTVNHWRTQNVQAVYYYRDGQAWQDHGVTGDGDVQECPDQSMTYYLRVVQRDGAVEQRAIFVDVTPAVNAPWINYFVADPPGQIGVGQCMTLRWDVLGNVARVKISSNDRVLWEQAPFRGSLQDCPGNEGTYQYLLEAEGPGGVSRATHLTVVSAQAVVTPTPPDAALPIIYAFVVEPTNIAAGMCVTIGWQIGGNATNVQIVRNGQMILDGVQLVGMQQDCLTDPGTYRYELRASDAHNQQAIATVVIQVD